MLYNIDIWVNHDEYEYDPDSWIMGPDDDFIPNEFNSTLWCYGHHYNMTWDDVMQICDTWAMTPGDHDLDITPAP